MNYITVGKSKSGEVKLYYKDWGVGQPIVFSHGWPLSVDAWEDQMIFLASHGYRCIAHDRRGHGRSSQPWDGYDMDTFADDLLALVESLDKAFSETDFTEDLKKIDVPTLIIHGDDDQIVPIDNSAKLSAKIIQNAQLKIYKGGSHGICSTHKNQINADLLDFCK